MQLALALSVALFACRDMLAPQRQMVPQPAQRYLNPSGRVVVYPDSLRGWSFYDDQQSTACTDATVCSLVRGPAVAPSGFGSAELAALAPSAGKALILADYNDTRLSRLTTLRYSTYRQTADQGNNLAIALQLNVDFDLVDNAVGYQGRLVYEPYQGNSGGVAQATWQTWDTKLGKWWGTNSSVTRNNVTTANPCVRTTPCTWTQVLSIFPNIGIHKRYGALVLKAGSGWPKFRGNVDNLTIGVDGINTTYDFELDPPRSAVPATAPDSVATAVWDSIIAPGNLIVDAPGLRGRWIRNTLWVSFKHAATQADREAAVALVNGEVVGGAPLGGVETYYVVRIPYSLAPGDGASGPILRAIKALQANPAVDDATPISMEQPKYNYVRPRDGTGFTKWAGIKG